MQYTVLLLLSTLASVLLGFIALWVYLDGYSVRDSNEWVDWKKVSVYVMISLIFALCAYLLNAQIVSEKVI